MSPIPDMFREEQLPPRIGQIKLGVQGAGAGGPRAVDHFVCPPEVMLVYGDAPRLLRIQLPSNNPDLVFDLWLLRKGKNGSILCKGDGKRAGRVDQQSGEIREVPCTYKECMEFQKGTCKAEGRLAFFLPDVPGLGVWWVTTHSKHSIGNIHSTLRRLLETAGRLVGIDLHLTLEPRQSRSDTGPKTIYVLHLRVPKTVAELADLEPDDQDELPAGAVTPPAEETDLTYISDLITLCFDSDAEIEAWLRENIDVGTIEEIPPHKMFSVIQALEAIAHREE